LRRGPGPAPPDGGDLLCGDNLALLTAHFGDATVDLVYLDPPFNSRASYRLRDDADPDGVAAFRDCWPWDGRAVEEHRRLSRCGPPSLRRAMRGLSMILGPSPLLAYLTMMAPRLLQLHRVLRPTGSIYLHCDGSASHYLKLLMDAVFGRESFLNNVVWLYGLGGSSRRYWPRKHDDLLWYAREPGRHHFEPALVAARSVRMRGKLKKMPDYWDVPAINNMAAERLGYPTQKPEALLELIIASSSRPGDLVLDPCCGSGTTLAVARRLGRRWAGIDSAPAAIAICRRRLKLPGPLPVACLQS
jgi:site-specific DNA-methyltransferase (adenine-specific)